MANYYRIPLTQGQRRFFVSLGETRVQISLIYRKTKSGGIWVMDVEKTNGGGVTGVPLLLGVDLFAQYSTLGLGSMWLERTDGGTGMPDYSDMGQNLALFWGQEYVGSVAA